MQPHFLFNTLNNIYSYSLIKSPKADELLLKLSNTLEYMIRDCKSDFVSLENELDMMTDYIGLETVRYGKRLNINVQITGDKKRKVIAPLLFIPFVENSFKHGAGKMRGSAWINLNIHISDAVLEFALSNSKVSANKDLMVHRGIGLNNVKKRLQLIYAQNHDLKLESREDEFSVFMKIPLQRAL